MANANQRPDRKPAIQKLNTTSGLEIIRQNLYSPPLGIQYPELNFQPIAHPIFDGSRATMEIDNRLYYALAIIGSDETTGILFNESGKEATRLNIPGAPDHESIFEGLKIKLHFGGAKKIDSGAFYTTVHPITYDDPSPMFEAKIKVPGVKEPFTVTGSAAAIRNQGHPVESRGYSFWRSAEILTLNRNGKSFTLLLAVDAIGKTRAVLLNEAGEVIMEQPDLTHDQAVVQVAQVLPYVTT